MPLSLIADNLSIERGGRTVIAALSLEAAAGGIVLLTGSNGAGKTTLVRALAGFIRPTAGTIALRGGPDDCTLAEQAHYVGHANAVRASLTVAETLAFWGSFLATGDTEPHRRLDDRIAGAADELGLVDLLDVPAGYLSAGQRRRLALARLLAAPRPLWLLDEPTAALDAASAAAVARIIRRHAEGGGITVAATHLPLDLPGAREVRLGASGGAA